MAYGQEGCTPPPTMINNSSALPFPAGTQGDQSPRSMCCSFCLESIFPPSLPRKFFGILRAQFNCHLLLEALPDPPERRSHSHRSSHTWTSTPVATLANYHMLGSYKQDKCIPSSFRRPEVRKQGVTRAGISLEAQGRISSMPFSQLPMSLAILGVP